MSVRPLILLSSRQQSADADRRKRLEAQAKYKSQRNLARELLEEQILADDLLKVDVVAIDDDILRKARNAWYDDPLRRVDWDWEQYIMPRHHRNSVRGIDFALLYQGRLCALAVARLSRRKRWLSLTYMEGAPDQHPLKGNVLAYVLTGLSIYKALIVPEDQPGSIGIRVLKPSEGAMQRYTAAGYNLSTTKKWLRSIVIEERNGD